jgi:hypothetical protein
MANLREKIFSTRSNFSQELEGGGISRPDTMQRLKDFSFYSAKARLNPEESEKFLGTKAGQSALEFLKTGIPTLMLDSAKCADVRVWIELAQQAVLTPILKDIAPSYVLMSGVVPRVMGRSAERVTRIFHDIVSSTDANEDLVCARFFKNMLLAFGGKPQLLVDDSTEILRITQGPTETAADYCLRFRRLTGNLGMLAQELTLPFILSFLHGARKCYFGKLRDLINKWGRDRLQSDQRRPAELHEVEALLDSVTELMMTMLVEEGPDAADRPSKDQRLSTGTGQAVVAAAEGAMRPESKGQHRGFKKTRNYPPCKYCKNGSIHGYSDCPVLKALTNSTGPNAVPDTPPPKGGAQKAIGCAIIALDEELRQLEQDEPAVDAGADPEEQAHVEAIEAHRELKQWDSNELATLAGAHALAPATLNSAGSLPASLTRIIEMLGVDWRTLFDTGANLSVLSLADLPADVREQILAKQRKAPTPLDMHVANKTITRLTHVVDLTLTFGQQQVLLTLWVADQAAFPIILGMDTLAPLLASRTIRFSQDYSKMLFQGEPDPTPLFARATACAVSGTVDGDEVALCALAAHLPEADQALLRTNRSASTQNASCNCPTTRCRPARSSACAPWGCSTTVDCRS